MPELLEKQIETCLFEGIAANKLFRFHGLVERETIKSPHESIPGSEDFLKDDLDIYFDFGIAAATKELSPQKLERSMWVLPVNLTTGIATLDPFLRYIATLKLKVNENSNRGRFMLH